VRAQEWGWLASVLDESRATLPQFGQGRDSMPLRGTTWHENGLVKESRAEYKGLIPIFVAVPTIYEGSVTRLPLRVK